LTAYDVVVVGAGHNGLASACILARRGLKVLVLERRDIVGGMCVTEEIFKNFKYDTGAVFPYWIKQSVVDEFQLTKRGLEFIDTGGITYTAIFPDGNYLTFYEDVMKTAEEIKRFSQRDAQAYVDLVAFWKKFKPIVDTLMVTLPPLDLINEFSKPLPVKLAVRKMLGKLPPGFDSFLELMKDSANLEAMAEFLFKSTGTMLNELFESEYVRTALLPESLEVSLSGPSSAPMSALVWRIMMKERTGRVKGGMGNFTLALRRAAEEAGAQVRTSAEVEKIAVHDGTAHGIKLKGGEEIVARIIASNADPHRTLLGLAGEDCLEANAVQKIRRYKLVASGLRLNFAVSKRPAFRIPDDRRVGAVMFCPSFDYAEKAFAEATMGDPPKRPLLLLDVPTITDTTLAPPGAHILQSWVNPTVYAPKQGSWDTIKESYLDNLVDLIDEFTPGFKGSILHKYIMTPVDFERRFYGTGGDVEHGDFSWYQQLWFRPMLGCHEGRTPIRNLYIVGSGIHPGGGVRALPGMIAARTILDDLRTGKAA
jgi:phytoene dehydrogenase-like protein